MKITKKRHTSVCSSNGGFSLIEVIVALAVLTIGILAVNAMQIVAVRGNNTANGITTSSNWAADRIEQIFGFEYDNDELLDTNNDLAAGLENKTTATADHTWVSPDGLYTIMWNVAEDVPMPNIKTVHIIVNRIDRDGTKSITLKYKKAKYI